MANSNKRQNSGRAGLARPPGNQTSSDLNIWQWNCRSIKKKLAQLAAYIQHSTNPPDIVALQETGSVSLSLPGYNVASVTSRTAILINKTLPFIDRTPTGGPSEGGTEYTALEMIPSNPTSGKGLLVVNIYSPPKDKGTRIPEILARTRHTHRIIVGDFNARHTAWGYANNTAKGNLLHNTMMHHALTLITDPTIPTRVGTSTARDTTPDLTMASTHVIVKTHEVLPDTLGSDHHVIQTILTQNSKIFRPKIQTLVDWDKLRTYIAVEDTTPQTLESWTKKIQHALDRAGKKIKNTKNAPQVDPHLLHLWEARRSLSKRWKRQRLNRKLRLRIAAVTEEAAQYATQLAQTNWANFCSSLKGTLGTKRTWNILRALLDPTSTKTHTNTTTHKLIYLEERKGTDIMAHTKTLYIPQPLPTSPNASPLTPPAPDENLDADVTLPEVKQALAYITRDTAPGPDRITYKVLRNLDDISLQELTDLFNEHWRKGTLPGDWKHAQISLIPKHGKSLLLQNLRPISLTSCVGKLFEHVIVRRLQPHLEAKRFFPDTQFGFRPNLSAQDVLLHIKETLFYPKRRTARTRAILALDIQKAFDNVGHEHILRTLATTGCGRRIWQYVKAFLENRTAEIRLGPLTSAAFALPNRGTPQGAVISPLLFNVAMAPLARELTGIPKLHHAFYADDMTLWVSQGSIGEAQDVLQTAINVIEQHISIMGLFCSPEKSELLTIKPYTSDPGIDLFVHGQPVPKVDKIRILGLHIQSNLDASFTLNLLDKQIKQISGLVRRITSRNHGLSEKDTMQMIEALVVSRLAYHLPYHHLTEKQLDQANRLIRRAVKTALRLPVRTSTTRLLQTGLYNTVQEIIEAQRSNQLLRLSRTPTGRNLLRTLGCEPSGTIPNEEPWCPIPVRLAAHMHLKPLPRNMNVQRYPGRRKARADYYARRYQNREDVLYVDAAVGPLEGTATVAAMTEDGRIKLSASVKTARTDVAEGVALALAVAHAAADSTITEICTDSQSAYRYFLQGIAPKTVTHILQNIPPLPHPVTITWVPGHECVPGNERVNAQVRGLSLRTPDDHSPKPTEKPGAGIYTYHQITTYYRKGRRELPAPHHSLTPHQCSIWRQIQTKALISPYLAHLFYPGLNNPQCTSCQAPRADLFHCLWSCPKPMAVQPIPNPSFSTWEAALRATCSDDQLWLVDRACLEMSARGLPDI